MYYYTQKTFLTGNLSLDPLNLVPVPKNLWELAWKPALKTTAESSITIQQNKKQCQFCHFKIQLELVFSVGMY